MVRDLRTSAQIDQKEAGDALGLDRSTISKIESGQRRLDVVELLRLCDACGASFADFAANFERRVRQIGTQES
jgi:transcriptional regulator with XRE-family HTH domain